MSRYLSDSLEKMQAYVPGEQPRDKQYIKLNTNESPFPPSDGVIRAVNSTAVENLRLYSDPECKVLKQKIASLYQVEPENVFISNGSDEALNFAFMAYGQKGVAFADITYGFYSVFASLYSLKTTVVPLLSDFNLNVEGFKGLNQLVVIANPNAPTGLTISLEQIEQIASSNDSVVIIDQAYVDFGGQSAVELTKKYKNLLCVHTYSKSRSMAGARLGFAIGDKQLIADLEKIKYSTNPYNVNTLTQIAGATAIDDDAYYTANCKKIIENREYLKTELKKLGFTYLDSKANFLFAKREGITGETLYLKLKEKGVLIRYFNKPRINDYIRITIGSYQEMQTFISKIKEILGE